MLFNKEAFEAVRRSLEKTIEFSLPDYNAAAVDGGKRQLELFVDACDYGWGATLAQRTSENGPHRPICCFSKSFSRTEQAWSTFEREFCGL